MFKAPSVIPPTSLTSDVSEPGLKSIVYYALFPIIDIVSGAALSNISEALKPDGAAVKIVYGGIKATAKLDALDKAQDDKSRAAALVDITGSSIGIALTSLAATYTTSVVAATARYGLCGCRTRYRQYVQSSQGLVLPRTMLQLRGSKYNRSAQRHRCSRRPVMGQAALTLVLCLLGRARWGHCVQSAIVDHIKFLNYSCK